MREWVWFSLLLLLISASQAQRYYLQDEAIVQSQPADDRTLISDMIGFSALKLTFFLAVPMFLSLVLGAMLVLLFPFPILTSTSGLAGAAAIGKRSGRASESYAYNLPDPQLLQILDGGQEFSVRTDQILDLNPQNLTQEPQPKKRVKKQFVSKHGEECVKRIACEIGRENKDPKTKHLLNQLIEELGSSKRGKSWNSVIDAYFQGLQSQSLVIVSSSPNPPPTPIYPHSPCPKYKCSL